jgi:hypothetical protein
VCQDSGAGTTPTETDRAVLRSMVQHEDQLRNQRLGWLLALNGFLFAALAFSWELNENELVYILGAVGFLTAVSSWVGLYTNTLAIQTLRDWTGTPPLVGLRTRDLKKPSGDGSGRSGWTRFLSLFYPWRAIPVILGTAWIVVAAVRWRTS